MMETLKEIVPEAAAPATEPEIQKTDGKPRELDRGERSAESEPEKTYGAGHALGILLEAGLKFLETLSLGGDGESGEKRSHASAEEQEPSDQPRSHSSELRQLTQSIEAAISPLIQTDSATDKAALHIPLPPSLTSERIAQTITAALSRLMAG